MLAAPSANHRFTAPLDHQRAWLQVIMCALLQLILMLQLLGDDNIAAVSMPLTRLGDDEDVL